MLRSQVRLRFKHLEEFLEHEKHNIEAATPSPTQTVSGEHSGMTAAVVYAPTGVNCCLFCPSRHLRLSRLRLLDWRKIIQFQLPVRCGRCGQRQYAPALIAVLCGRHKVMRKKQRKKKPEVSWGSWTGTGSGERNAHPAPTASEATHSHTPTEGV